MLLTWYSNSSSGVRFGGGGDLRVDLRSEGLVATGATGSTGTDGTTGTDGSTGTDGTTGTTNNSPLVDKNCLDGKFTENQVNLKSDLTPDIAGFTPGNYQGFLTQILQKR